jgi:hypothetical protein
MMKRSHIPTILIALPIVMTGMARAQQQVLPIEVPGAPLASGGGPKFLPFPAPLADPDITQIPPVPVGAKMVSLGLGRVLAIGPKGTALVEPRPADPMPADLVTGAPNVEIRPDGHRTPTADYAVFMETAQHADDPLTKLVVFIKVFASADGRLAACGFHLREPTRPDIGSPNRFEDPRSYVQIGALARLPTIFIGDATPKYMGEVPGSLETILGRPQDLAPIVASCVTSNIAWTPAYAAAPLSLHLQFPAFQYTFSVERSYMRP